MSSQNAVHQITGKCLVNCLQHKPLDAGNGRWGENTVQLTWTAELGQVQIFWAVGHAKVTESKTLILCPFVETFFCEG